MKTENKMMGAILLSILFTISTAAQNTDQIINEGTTKNDSIVAQQYRQKRGKSYNKKEQWYIQIQGGANYTFAENIRNHPFGKGLAPSYAFSVGKNFSTIWGARLQMIGGGDKGRFFDESPYSFNHIGGSAAVVFNLTNLIRNRERGNESNWNVMLLLGPGITHTYNFETDGAEHHENRLDLSSRNHFLLYGGIELSYRVAESWVISLEANTSWTRDKYNGLIYDRKYDGLGQLMLGVRYIFGNK